MVSETLVMPMEEEVLLERGDAAREGRGRFDHLERNSGRRIRGYEEVHRCAASSSSEGEIRTSAWVQANPRS